MNFFFKEDNSQELTRKFRYSSGRIAFRLKRAIYIDGHWGELDEFAAIIQKFLDDQKTVKYLNGSSRTRPVVTGLIVVPFFKWNEYNKEKDPEIRKKMELVIPYDLIDIENSNPY